MQRKSPKGGVTRRDRTPQDAENRREQRRVAYASDPATADSARQASRERYQRENGKAPSRLANGLLARGTEREVTCTDLEHPVIRESFTIPDAAEALGKPLATIRRWIADDKMPEPYLWETTRQTKVFTVGELEVVARHIAQHEASFSYLVENSSLTEMLHQAIHAYRAEFI